MNEIYEAGTRSTWAITQGDSYGKDISSADVPTFGATWSGSWAISQEIGGTPILSGSLTKSDDTTQMLCRITKVQTATILPGEWYLFIRVDNSADGFSKEILRESLTVHEGTI